MSYTTEYQKNSAVAKHLVKNTCQKCGKSDVKLDTHHIVPLRLGGSDDLENLLVVCRPCHRKEDNQHRPKMKKGFLLSVDIPSELHQKLKQKALDENTTIKIIVNELLKRL